LKNEPYRLTEFERRKEVNFLNMKISIVSPEDLIILICLNNSDLLYLSKQYL
jgi:hypothetical protein